MPPGDYDGTFVQDWEYVAGSGELDECNGRVGPDGTYRYHATKTFPYILGCYKGTPTASAPGGANRGGAGGPPNNGGGQQGGGPPNGAPASCTTDADCEGECNGTALGCVCHDGPMGMMCVPSCNTSADCPNNLNCHTDAGICIPGGGGAP